MRKFPGLYYASSSFCLVEALVRIFSVVVTSGSEPSSLGARRLELLELYRRRPCFREVKASSAPLSPALVSGGEGVLCLASPALVCFLVAFFMFALSGGDLDWFDASLREEDLVFEESWWFRRRLFGLMSSVGTSFAARQFRRCFQAVTVEWRRKR
ncbi:hypothetical protein F2Q69_00018045 [Brassica cretica]|uniref:Transmembrane protein n=1 Tax=Brassica cretica TaxID=69181 RepID=A0A8S9QLZ5_BRACR|nr:hypothetical protein F2Q69_00018045 [Brassica cretica]